MAKLQFDKRQFKLTLSKKLLEAIGWRKGDEIQVELDQRGNILLKNKKREQEETSELEKIDYAG